MKKYISIILIFVISCFLNPVLAELVVIVHPDNPVSSLTRNQLVDIYMGRDMNFPNGRQTLPIDLDPDSPYRAVFYQALVGKTVNQVNAYWARLLFTGRATPPRVLSGAENVLKVVSENKDAIAYIDTEHLNDEVKVVYKIK